MICPLPFRNNVRAPFDVILLNRCKTPYSGRKIHTLVYVFIGCFNQNQGADEHVLYYSSPKPNVSKSQVVGRPQLQADLLTS